MNEFEKKAIKMLSEEEREKIVGGTADTDELSKEQCDKLRHAVDDFSEEKRTLLADILRKRGFILDPKEPTYRHPIMMYGGPKPHLPSTKKIITNPPLTNET